MSVEMYFSVDIETDGGAPGLNNMLSLGIVPIPYDSQFYVTLHRLPDARPDPQTMQWWADFPGAWATTRHDPQDPAKAMQDAEDFVGACLERYHRETGETAVPVFCASPACFDFAFYNYYALRFLGRTRFNLRAMDIRSYVMCALNQPYLASTKNEAWATKLPHTHNALDDALAQADTLRKLLAWRNTKQLVEKEKR